MPSETELLAWDRDHVWHPFTPMQAYRDETTPMIVAGDGFFLIDAQGKKFLDGVSSLWCNVHGHRVPAIDSAIRAQLDRIAHTTLLGLGSGPSAELAEELTQWCPAELSKVFYSDSGATAVESALKIAYQYQKQKPGATGKRDLYVAVGDAYHGDTLGSVSVGGISLFHDVYGRLLFPTLRVPAPVAYRTPAGQSAAEYLRFCFDEMERILRTHADRIAAFVIEPLVQGAAGILVHPAGYLRQVREVTRELGIVLIADEVAVGCGRTGKFLACEHEQVVPDLLCLAKGLSGGYLPLAATLATETLYDAFLGEPWDNRTFFHGHTFTGNPLACAAALASLHLLRENNVLANVRAIEQTLQKRIADWLAHAHVGEVRLKGAMCGIELVADKPTKRAFDPKLRVGHQVICKARERGVAIRPLGDVIVLMPAPAMPVTLVEELCDVVTWAIGETCGRLNP